MSKPKSLLQIHAAVFLFGLSGLFGKLLDIPSVVIVLGRVFFASASLLIVVLSMKQSLRLPTGRSYLSLGLLGLLLAVHWITFFESIQRSTVGIGLLTFSTFPVFTAFLEPIFFKERLRARDGLVGLVAFAGVGFVVPTFSLENQLTQGALWGVVSGGTFSVLSILNRRSVQRYSNLVIAFYQDLGATVLLFPFLLFLDFSVGPRDIALLAILGIVFTGLSHSLFINGLKNIKAKTASIIVTLEPVYGIAAAALVLGEIPTSRMLIGGALILAAAVYETVAAGRNRTGLP